MNDSVQNKTDTKLTNGGRKLIETLLDPRNRTKSVVDVCKLAEISRTTYYKLFNDPKFVEEYKKQSKEMITQSIGGVINTFINEARRGSFQHGKVVLEMAGLYSEKTENVNHNIEHAVTEEESKELLSELLNKLSNKKE